MIARFTLFFDALHAGTRQAATQQLRFPRPDRQRVEVRIVGCAYLFPLSDGLNRDELTTRIEAVRRTRMVDHGTRNVGVNRRFVLEDVVGQLRQNANELLEANRGNGFRCDADFPVEVECRGDKRSWGEGELTAQRSQLRQHTRQNLH